MGEIEVIKRNGESIKLSSKDPFRTIRSAVQNTSLMGDDNIKLSIVASDVLSFEKGDKIIVAGEEYTVRSQPSRELQSDSYYIYDVTFYGVMYDLMKTQYRNTDESGKSTAMTFDLTYSIKDFAKVLIYNMNRDYPGLWQFDEENCPDTEPRTMSFSKQNCLQVLQTLCNESNFNLEFRITQHNGIRTIHIGKFGTTVTPPNGSDYFEWGKGNGLFTLKEQKVDDKAVITRLWVEGGTTNIRSDYRDYSERLQLPCPRRMNKHEHELSDGTVIPANSEMIGIDDDSKRYIEDSELAQEIGCEEDSEQYGDIYPKRTGKVTALVDGDINSFIDDTMDFDLNEKDENGTKYLINETTAKITFTTGRLAGQQFELKKEGGYDHSAKKFTIIPFTDQRGLTTPTVDNEAFRIAVNDQYKITDINLPKSYEDDAEEELWYAGYDDFKPRTQARVQYALTFDRSYFLDNLPNDSETCLFKVGDYVPVKDTRFNVEKNIRIQKVSRNLLVDHDYNLTLSDTTTISITQQTVIDVIDHENIIEINRLRDPNKARRGWRTTEDLRSMVYDTDGYFDPENIRPNSIDTNMLTVGSKSQQFILSGVIMQANANGNANRFKASSGILSHFTIDENSIRQWNLGETIVTLSEQGGYYVFAKCSKTGKNGVFVVTQTPYKSEPTEDPNNYYFQIGIISALYPDDNFRDFVTTYGFTRINGKTITTGAIVTSDGECYLDLDGNRFRIGDSASFMDWNVTAKDQLTFKNVRIVSQGGASSEIGCYRGVYNHEETYYKGDEVTYTQGDSTSTYRHTSSTPTKHILPTNTSYWTALAQGGRGEQGPAGAQGEQGATGPQGPAQVFRGIFSRASTYYGNEDRVDVVKYGSNYYVAKTTAGSFSGMLPTNTGYWTYYGAQFDSIATGLLLAENANIAGWVFRNNRLESQNGNVYLDGNTGEVRLKGTLQLSTGYTNEYTDVNLFNLPAITTTTSVNLGSSASDIGKVCRMFNSGGRNDATYMIRLNKFYVNSDGSTSVTGYTYAYIKPKETYELSCFELPPDSSGRQIGEWRISNIYGEKQFNSSTAGRHPIIYARGKLSTDSNGGISLEGEWWEGTTIQDKLGLSKLETGKYKIRLSANANAGPCAIMVCGYGNAIGSTNHPIKATVMSDSYNEFEIWTSDDETVNDGSFLFIIYSTEWATPNVYQ